MRVSDYAQYGQPVPGYQHPAIPKPRPLGLILAITLFVLGIGIGVALIVGGVLAATRTLEGAARHSVGGAPVSVSLSANEPMAIWAPGGSPIYCAVTDAAGVVIPQTLPVGTVTVNNVQMMTRFTPTTAGAVGVQCDGPAGSSFLVAPPLETGDLAGSIIGGVVSLLLGVLGGVGLLIAYLVRRSRWRHSQFDAGRIYPNPADYPASHV